MREVLKQKGKHRGERDLRSVLGRLVGARGSLDTGRSGSLIATGSLACTAAKLSQGSFGDQSKVWHITTLQKYSL